MKHIPPIAGWPTQTKLVREQESQKASQTQEKIGP